MRIKKGDTIKLLTGKDKGKTGKVLKAMPADNKVLAEGLNMFKKHVKPKRQGEKGQTVTVPRPITISNVMLVCPSCGAATRVGYVVDGDKKSRQCKKCNARI